MNKNGTGYDSYYQGMKGSVDAVYKFTFSNRYSHLDTLKHWLSDHNEGSTTGGLAIIPVKYYNWQISRLPQQSAHAGECVFTALGNGGSHAITIVGYDDNVMYDLNGDGVIDTSNNLDNREKGAFKIVNSWGDEWCDTGFCWLPYYFIKDIILWGNDKVAYMCKVKEKEPDMALKIKLRHPTRNKLTFYVGKKPTNSFNINYYCFEHTFNKGGEFHMRGCDAYNNTPIEIGLDYSNKIPFLVDLKEVWLKIQDTSISSNAIINNFSLVDYRWNEIFELPCSMENVIIHNGDNELYIDYYLLPHEYVINTPYICTSNRIARRTVQVSSKSTFTLNDNQSITMYGTDNYDARIIIDTGSMLSLGNNAKIVAKKGHCEIVMNGMLDLGYNVTFTAEDDATLHITFNNDNLNLDNATFINCELSFPDKSISLTNCNFISTPVNLDISDVRYAGQSAIISGCRFNPGDRILNSAISIKGYGTYSISNCSICNDDSNNGYFRNGIMAYYCGKNLASVKDITNNTIRNCQQAGLVMYNSTGNVTMNQISDNGIGVKLLNNSSINRFSGNGNATTASATQYIHDNDSYEVYMTKNCKPQNFLHNAITDDGSTAFIHYDPYVSFANINEPSARGIDYVDVRNNWWNSTDSAFIASHLTANSMNIMPDTIPDVIYEFLPTWQMGNGGFESRTDELLLATADSLRESGSYTAAMTIYMQVVEDYPYTTSSETALKTMLFLEYYASNDYEVLKDYYLSDAVITSDTMLTILASSLANKCDEILENYEDAIAWYEAVIMNPASSYNDSIFATIDLGNLYLKIENQGDKGVRGKLIQFVPKSCEAYRMQRDYALALIPHSKYSVSSAVETLSVEENNIEEIISIYPNPAGNQMTIIGKNLQHVEIYNIMGQKILTVTNTSGEDEMLVDLSSCGSGVYFIHAVNVENVKAVKKIVKR